MKRANLPIAVTVALVAGGLLAYVALQVLDDGDSDDSLSISQPSSSAVPTVTSATSTTVSPTPEAVRVIDGVYFVRRGTPIPDEATVFEDICDTQVSEDVGLENAGEMGLELELPEMYKLNPQSLNTGAAACGGVVYATRWDYEVFPSDGRSAGMVVTRSPLNYDETWGPIQYLQEREVGGLTAITYISNPRGPGGSNQSLVVFPGSPVTRLYGFSLTEEELLEVAEIVAAALQEQG
jgi:hypothetical protein